MKGSAGSLHRTCILLAALLIAAALSACVGNEGSPEAAPSPPTMQTAITLEALTATPDPTTFSTAAPARGGDRMSLDEYAAFCAELEAGETTEEEGEITYGEFSEGLELYIGVLESVSPHEEVSVWHKALLASQRE